MPTKGGYGRVYQDVTRNPNISAAAKGLYAYLSAFCGVSDECYPSVETITQEMNITKDTFYRHIGALVAAGVVTKQQQKEKGKFARTLYRLTHEVTISEKSVFPIPNFSESNCSESTASETIKNSSKKEQDKKVTGSIEASVQQIADLYCEICKSYPKVRSLSETRKKAIKARLRKYSLDDFRELFEKAEASDFLKGSNSRNWTATFDWLINEQNMTKVLEGNYQNRREESVNGTGNNQDRRPASDRYRGMLKDGDC